MNSASQGRWGDPYGDKPDTYRTGYPTVAENQTVALKPCPFCGGNNVDFKHYNVKNNDWWYVSCEDCEIALDPLYFNGQTKEQAIERWNRRANE